MKEQVRYRCSDEVTQNCSVEMTQNSPELWQREKLTIPARMNTLTDEIELNRGMPNDMYGGVRGRALPALRDYDHMRAI